MNDFVFQLTRTRSSLVDYQSGYPDYFVKWQGLPYADCTWEDGELISRDFQHCIEDYTIRSKSQKIPARSAKVNILFPYNWTINKELERRLEATETWFCIVIMNISWTEKIINGEVFRKAKGKGNTITHQHSKKRQMQSVSQIYIKDNLEKTMLTWKIARKKYPSYILQNQNKWATKNEISNTQLLKNSR